MERKKDHRWHYSFAQADGITRAATAKDTSKINRYDQINGCCPHDRSGSREEHRRCVSKGAAKQRNRHRAGDRPVAIIKPSKPAGRMISEVIADLKARGSSAVMDDDFARDIEEAVKAQRQPWNPPSWD